jgi:hypothetical protein
MWRQREEVLLDSGRCSWRQPKGRHAPERCASMSCTSCESSVMYTSGCRWMTKSYSANMGRHALTFHRPHGSGRGTARVRSLEAG